MNGLFSHRYGNAGMDVDAAAAAASRQIESHS